MVITVTSQSGKKFSKQEIRVITETIKDMNPFFLREFKSAGSFPEFIKEMEKLEIFKWLDEKKKMRYAYTGDILVEIDLLPFFRDYQLKKILNKEMEVYLVIGDFGSWDGHHTETLKVFDSKEKAKSFKKNFENDEKIRKYKDLYHKKVYGEAYDGDGGEISSLSEEELAFFEENAHAIFKYHDFNNCFIEKYIVE